MGDNESLKEIQSSEIDSDYDTPAAIPADLRREVLHELIKKLPKNIQARIRSLKNIQLEQLKLEAEYCNEVYNLQKKYHTKYQELFDKRTQLVHGEVDPPINEVQKWKNYEGNKELMDKAKEISLKIQKKLNFNFPDDIKCIPNFWLTIFRNTETFSEMVQEHDEPVLRKLRDIKIVYGDDENKPSYTVVFHFDKNEYFSNSFLTKEYFLRSSVDEMKPFSFAGSEIYKCKGCNIDWEKQMNLTVKTIKKRQKHKRRHVVRTITEEVQNDSFFNFFGKPKGADVVTETDDDSETDFEIGNFLRFFIVPKAILYYTGDLVEDSFDESYDEEEGSDEDDEEFADDELQGIN